MDNQPIYAIRAKAETLLHDIPSLSHQLGNDGKKVYVFDHVEYPDDQAILAYYVGMKYPVKGLPYEEACNAVNIVKRMAMVYTAFANKDMLLPALGFALLPYKRKLRQLSRMLETFVRLAEWPLTPYYLKEQYYCKTAKELLYLVRTFLTKLGIDEQLANRVGQVVAMFMEYDNAYRYRVQDILSETTKERLLKHPITELKRLIAIFNEREQSTELATVGGKFNAVFRMLSFAFYHPKFKAAFTDALQASQFSNLQFDEADRHHCLNRNDYQFFGQTIEQRMAEYDSIYHGEGPLWVLLQPNH